MAVANFEVVEFGDGREPWSVGRGNIVRWMHCLVREVAALPAAQRAELHAWLAERGANVAPASLLVSRGRDGYRLHVPGGALAVELAALPRWLQAPTPEPAPQPAPAPAAKAAKAAKSGKGANRK